MPYVPVPKDLSRVKNKIAFNLTRRQLVCFALAGAVGIPFYLFSRSAIGTDAAALCMIGLSLAGNAAGRRLSGLPFDIPISGLRFPCYKGHRHIAVPSGCPCCGSS